MSKDHAAGLKAAARAFRKFQNEAELPAADRKPNSGWCQRLSCSLFHMAFSCCGFGRMKRLHPREGKSGAFHDRPDNSQDC